MDATEATCVHDLTLSQISDFLTAAKIDVTNCTLLHPTEDTVLSFDMLSGNKRFMFSDGRSYFTDVLKSLSLRRVIESTIVRSFFDAYTAKDALSDWKKLVKDTQSLFQKDSCPADLYNLFTSDTRRMLKAGVEQTMYSIDTTCNKAQRTLIQALHFHAVLNMVPCMEVVQQQDKKLKMSQAGITKVSNRYSYEHHIAQACMKTEHGVHLTHSVPPQEDTVVVFDFAAKKPLAFVYEGGKISQLEVMFFGGASGETFTRRGRNLVQTHSLCETVIQLEKYLHEMETMHMKVLKDVAFRSTVIAQNADDCEGHTTKKIKLDEETSNRQTDPYVANIIEEYKKEIGDTWQTVTKTIKEIAEGSTSAAQVPLNGRNVTEQDLKSGMNVNVVGNIITEDGINVLSLVQELKNKQGPLGGRALDTSLAHIESGTTKLQKEFVKQHQNNIALRRAMTVWQKTHSLVCKRNGELLTDLVTSKRCHTMQTRTMTKLQSELDATKADLHRIASTMAVPRDSPDSDQNNRLRLQVNGTIDVKNQDHYNADTSQQNDTHCIRYVNVSDFSDKRLRYLNANFCVPPVDESIREATRKAWESEVKSRYFLRDHVYSSTGNHMERQPSYDTTSVYIGEFCKKFMDFRVMGRVVFDSNFNSKTDIIDYMFACEFEGSAIDVVNKMQS